MLQRGLVVALRRNGGVGMIWSSDREGTVVVPIGGYNGPPRHRAEVRISDPAEHIACGVSFRYPAARCHLLFRLPAGGADDAQILGFVPPALLQRIVNAVYREARAQAEELRLFLRSPQPTTTVRMAVAV